MSNIPNVDMSKEEMNQFLESIGGLESGWKVGDKITDCYFFDIGEGWHLTLCDEEYEKKKTKNI
jgi:hypothetical protein